MPKPVIKPARSRSKVDLAPLALEEGSVDSDVSAFPSRKQRLRHKSFESIETPEEVASGWLQTYGEGLLAYDDILRYHFRILVPYLYAPRAECNCLLIKCSEEDERKRILEPLERFLSNNIEPEAFFRSLSVIDKPESFCGHVFGLGEPTYACRDCGLDPTCVLCVECFKVSPHRNHRYKIANSAGGGYCDCGDAEAWKKDVYCETHEARITDVENHCLPEDVQERAKFLFDILIPYCYDRLIEPFRQQLPDYLLIEQYDLGQNDMKGLDEVYCTILYNDETHTFENVIQTLTRALGCSKKDAIEFASFIDREGRSIVKCSNFAECNRVSDLIDRHSTRNGGKPLAVSVVRVIEVAHELFAIRLLSWIQKIVSQASGYRETFYDVMMMVSEDYASRRQRSKKSNSEHVVSQPRERTATTTILEGIMLSDTTIWKSARAVWHHLFATALLKDYKTKKKFAAMFTKHYVEIMKDFIADDHEHAFSITSLSVQIFTVPTIARYLMDKGDAFYSILRSFMTECEPRLGPTGKLEFERGATVGPFRRTSFATLDLKYLLTSPPTVDEWSETFKRHFLHGFGEFVKLLRWMQEMDAAVRQTGAHMEYEAEWETAFNIFIKLAPVVSLVVDWCATKKSILIRAYRSILSDIGTLYSSQMVESEKCEFANHTVNCYKYDVSSQPASIHLPLTRLWAALHLRLKEYNLDYFSSEFSLIHKPSPEVLIEPVLRAQVLYAQVIAGMWKRNGYSILNQLFFYRNVRCRSDMFDKDILALQIGAFTMDSNVFLIHLLNRFDLFKFITEPSYDTLIPPENETERQISVLLEEFLGLIISIVSARYTPGVGLVTEQDCTKKEIIQLLCVKPMTHSVLNKSMVENVNYETGVEQVIGEVATAKKQSGGLLYELNPELYSEYDVFFYHYTREQMSFAENRQLSRKKVKNEAEFFPPPRLPLFAPTFQLVVNILKSDALLKVIAVVLKRSVRKQSSCTDSQLRRTFHLIGYALNEESFQSELKLENPFQFCEAATEWKIFNLLGDCLSETSLSQHHHMIRWILNQHSLIKSNVPILTKNIHILSGPSREDEEIVRRKRLAAEAREKMLAKMSAAQNEFRAINADLFDQDELMPDVSGEDPELLPDVSIVLGPNQSRRSSGNELFTCILCQESQSLTEAAGFTLPIFIQRSTVLCQNRHKLIKAWGHKLDNKHLWRRNILFLHPDLRFAPHISCCGHVMHSTCWQRHFETVLVKERRRPYRLRHLLTFDVDKNEYLCPMCQCLCNAVMPMVVPSNEYFPPLEHSQHNDDIELNPNWQPEYQDWFSMCLNVARKAKRITSEYLPTDEAFKDYCVGNNANPGTYPDINLWKTEEIEEVFASASLVNKKVLRYFFPRAGRGLLRDETMETTTLFIHSIFTKGLAGKPGSDGEFRFPALTWQAIAFTIINAEVIHRDQNLPFFGKEVAVRQAASMNYTVQAGCLVSVYCQLYDTDTLQSTALNRLVALMGTSHDTPSILKMDAFGLLVSLTFSIPALFLEKHYRRPLIMGNLQDFYLLRTVTIMHLVQIILTGKFEDHVLVTTPAVCESEHENNQNVNFQRSESFPSSLALTCVVIWEKHGHNMPPVHRIDWIRVYNTISQAMMPYLRCCCKFYECLTGIPTPKCLESVESRFEDLVTYLGLPQSLDSYCDQYSNSETVDDLGSPNDSLPIAGICFRYVNHPRITMSYRDFLQDGRMPSWMAYSYPRKIPKLIDLPDDYAELLNNASVFACRTCGTHECRIPTMCLICGETLCSQSYCCQDDLKGNMVGACTYHAHFCGGSIGIFLRIRECKVFFLGGRGKGCFVSPPYLDEYGETDQGLRRGNPMKLCKEKYDDFRRSWMLHKIHDDIAANTEQIPTLVATEWQYL